MRIKSAALVLLFLFTCIHLVFGYTVLLKNGKKIEGIFVEENEEKILIKDKDGIVLTFRKGTLDLERMKQINTEKIESEPPPEKSPQTRPAQTQNTEKNNKRVFKNEDLKDLPELSIIGSESSSDDPNEEMVAEDFEDQSLDAEAFWKEETRKLADRLYDAKDYYESLKKDCKDAQDALTWYVLNGIYLNSSVGFESQQICDEANQAKAEYEHWEQEMEEFQERARREGALPGWVDPERL